MPNLFQEGCPRAEQLQLLAAGDLPAEHAAKLRRHLETCPPCATQFFALSPAGDHTPTQQHTTAAVAAAATLAPPPPAVRSPEPTVAPDSQPIQGPRSQGATAHGDSSLDATLGIPPAAPYEATQLGPYRLLTKLGEGGMGAVYKAQHEHLDKTVAVKVLPRHVTQHADAIARFKREMKAVGKLNHPNIVQAHDAGEIDGVHYLAMEFVEGTDLQKLVKQRGPLSVVNACKVIRQAAQALAAAHAAGLVHRDIKPANLLLAKSGQIKVLDLGLALLGSDSAETYGLTTAGQTFGTPDYMAPEQWNDAHAADARTDLYALGCTLYFLLVGRAPYATPQHATTVGKMKAHVLEAIPDLQAAAKDVPAELAEVYRKLLAKDSANRYQTAAELSAALAPFSSSKGQTTPAASAAMIETAPASQPDATAPTLPIATQPAIATIAPATQAKPTRRIPRKLAIALGAAAFALLLGVIIIKITNPDGTETTLRVPEGVQTDVQAAPGSKVTITQTNNLPANAPPTTTSWHGWPADAPKPAIAPFDVAQAKWHQEEWAKYLNVPVEYENSIGMRFRLIPPGGFLMGSTQAEIDEALALPAHAEGKPSLDVLSEGPRHAVALTQPYYLSTYEVTQVAYETVTGQNPAHYSPQGQGAETVHDLDTSDFPVDSVSWRDVQDFCKKLASREKLNANKTQANPPSDADAWPSYRLPTEAEWEFACRAGATTRYSAGETETEASKVAWYGGNSEGRPHRVGQLEANAFGLYDMHGNAWEWCLDTWDRHFFERAAGQTAIDPRNTIQDGPFRTIRGGGWAFHPLSMRAGRRGMGEPTKRDPNVGFRVCLSVDAVKKHRVGAKPSELSDSIEIAPPWPWDPANGKEFVWSEPHNLGPVVNAFGYNYGPRVTDDGLEMWYVGNGYRKVGEGDDDLWITRRKSRESPWETPVNVGKPVNTASIEKEFSLTGDGLTLFSKSDDAPGGIRMFARIARDQAWSAAQPVLEVEASANFPVVSRDGLSLYFEMGSGTAGLGGRDIWLTTRKTVTDAWSPPEVLPAPVNSPVDDWPCWLSADGAFLIFASQRAGGFGDFDLWYIRCATDAKAWSSPANFGPTINKAGNEQTAHLSADGATLWFGAGAPRPGQIQWLEIWESRRVPRDVIARNRAPADTTALPKNAALEPNDAGPTAPAESAP